MDIFDGQPLISENPAGGFYGQISDDDGTDDSSANLLRSPIYEQRVNLVDINESEDLPVGVGVYDDFQTIDWISEAAKDRTRHRKIVKKRYNVSFEVPPAVE